MSIFVEFVLSVDALPLGKPLLETGDIRVELERIVPFDESVLPFFWAIGPEENRETFANAARDRAAIRRLTPIDAVGDRTLFRAEWSPRINGVITGIEAVGATVLKGTGTLDGWDLELRFPNQSNLIDFQQYCMTHDIEIKLKRIRRLVEPEPTEKYNLTDIQRETILLAYELGYFDEPRDTDLAELATMLGIGERAVSRRLTRGIRQLIANTVATEGER